MYRCLGLCVAILVLVGCNRGAKAGLATGTITFKKKPVEKCRLEFRDTKGKLTPIVADAGPDGRYLVQLPVGEYKVGIKESAVPGPDGKVSQTVPTKYNDPEKSNLTVTVKLGENTQDFELKD